MDQRKWVDRMFRAHAKELYRYLRTFRLPEEDTYDLVQDAFVKMLDADPAKLRNPKVWLFTVGRNQAINALKRNRCQPNNTDIESIIDDSAEVLTGLLKNEARSILWEAFLKLPAGDREMMDLYLEHEFSYRQIATVLGKSEVSVRVAMHRSRNRLRDLIQSVEGLSSAVYPKGNEDDSKEKHR